MGCGSSMESTDESRNIDAELRAQKRKQDKEIKLLVLGASESGKSTIVKQFQIVNGYFSEEQRKRYQVLLRKALIECVKILIRAAKRFEISYSSPEIEEIAQTLLEFRVRPDEITPELGQKISKWWSDSQSKSVLEKKGEFYLPECAEYLLEHITRLCAASYVPTNEDCLRVRQRTTGIVETTLEVKKTLFRIVDVGGQRNERKKWIHSFDTVMAIIFVAPLDEYDQRLSEDHTVNRMLESLKLFKDIATARLLKDVPLILFLNKKDLLMDKIKDVQLDCLFKEFTGGSDVDRTIAFIRNTYLHFLDEDRDVYTHVTNALDTKNIERVWNDVMDICNQLSLKKNNML